MFSLTSRMVMLLYYILKKFVNGHQQQTIYNKPPTHDCTLNSMAEAGAEACRQLRPVLIVLELTPLTPIEIIKAHEIQKLPPPLLGREGGVAKMVQVPEGEFFMLTTPTLWVKNFIIY